METNVKNGKELIDAVAFTIIYYNVSGYPPTTFEIWKHLIKRDSAAKKESGFKKITFNQKQEERHSLWEVIKALESKSIEKQFSCVDSFWIMKENSALVRQRIKKQKIAIAKIKKLKRWARIASGVPFLRGIFINGTLAMKRANNLSDWDVLLVMKKNRIWIGRFFISVFFHFLFKRRHHDKIKDRFCLNHFLTEDGLILEESGVYSANEIMFAVPVYGKKIFDKFIQLNEFQMKKSKPNYAREKMNDFFIIKESLIIEKIKAAVEWFLEITFLAEILNRVSKEKMIDRIKNNPKTYIEGADIRYSDQALIFLPQPRRGIILKRAVALFEAKMGG